MDSALFPLIEQIERAADLHRSDTVDQKLAKIDALLQHSNRGNYEAAWLIAELMSLPHAASPVAASLTPQRRKQMILEVLLRYVASQSEQCPLLIEFEDVHWADSATIEFLTQLIERMSTLPALVAITARPEFTVPWPAPEQGAEIRLTRLNRRESAELATWVARDHPVAPQDIDRIVDRAEGVPLFIEELTKTIVEKSDAIGEAARLIPISLESSLLARLHRLSSVSEVAAAAAAIGRQFSGELVGEVTSLADGALSDKLDRLVKAGLIFRRGTPPDTIYTFKHALVRDAVYLGLGSDARRSLHERIAQVIESKFPDLAQSQPGVVAQHFMEGHLFDKAVEYAFRAGRQAVAIAAMREAIGQLRLALAALERLPDDRSRAEREVDILLVLLTALVSVRGYTAAETAETYARARERCRQIGTISRLEAVDHGIYRQYLVEANYEAALRVCQDGLAAGRSGWELGIGIVTMHQGHIATALDHLQRAHAAIRSRAATENLEVLSVIGAPAYLALCHALRGECEQTRGLVQEALALSVQSSHPTARAFALCTTARVTWLVGLEAENLEIARELAALCRKHDFRYWLANAECYLGWHLAKSGRAAAGVAEIEHALTEYRNTAARWLYPFFLAMAAEADRADGRPLHALRRIEEALSLSSATGELWYDGGLLRLRGALLRQTGDLVESEKCLQSARVTIDGQGASLYAPAIATELAALCEEQHRSKSRSYRCVASEVPSLSPDLGTPPESGLWRS